MKLKEVFEKSVQFFKDKKIETPRLDAELLISHALKVERVQIYLKYEQPLSQIEIAACREAVRRRGLGEPVAYITNEKGFFGEMYTVGAGVLIPRPETELVVEEALAFIKANSIKNPKILDLGAGTGCIGFSILINCTNATLISVEKSEDAFKYLAINQLKFQLAERSQLILDDAMTVNLDSEKFDIIVANPPYISEKDDQIDVHVKKYEPHQALFAQADGFAALYDWSRKFKEQLNRPGLLLLEVGCQQGPKLKQYLEDFKQFSNVKILKDLSGLDRVIKSTQ